MKQTKIMILSLLFSISLSTFATEPEAISQAIKIELSCQHIDKSELSEGTHRTPVQIPNVYLDNSASSLIFENPCYECTLELIVPGTETVAYTYSIPDGDNVVILPEWLSGQYELHIHRGNFCFWGVIEL